MKLSAIFRLNVKQMKEEVITQLKESARVKLMVAERLSDSIVRAAEAIAGAFRAGGKLLIIGNGGSAADAQHIAAEFISRFKLERKALPAIALTTDSSILSAIGNDCGFELVFSRQVEALANHPADILFAISTSGASVNVLKAIATAKEKNIKTVALTKHSGPLKDMVDFPIAVPSEETQRIQEAHGTIAHIICDLVERTLFV